MARTNYDSKRVIELLEQAMEGRSARAYSEATDINPAIISRIKNGDYRPGKKILVQIAQENPDAVSLDELMIAAGYSEKDINETKAKALANIFGTFVGTSTAVVGTNFVIKALAAAGSAGVIGLAPVLSPLVAPAVATSVIMHRYRKTTNIIKDYESTSIDEREKRKVEQLKANQKRFKTIAMGMIYQSLISKKVFGRTIEANNVDGDDLFLRESLLIDNIKGDDKRLDLYFVHFEESVFGEIPLSEDDMAVALLSKFAFDEPVENKQIDIITDSKEYYESLEQFANKISIKANIVALLIDVEKTEIAKESVITTYKDQESGNISFMEDE